jgi:peptidyl-prolyl cis-trans isomerase D
MAAIGSIRKRSGLLIVIIGFSLVLFLLGDLFSGGSNLFSSQDVSVGTIAGQDINQRDYEIKVREAIDKQFGPEGSTEQQKQQIRDRVWSQMVNDRTLKLEFERLGIAVSPDELLDQVQNTQQGSILYQYFSDPQSGQVIEQFRDPVTGGLDSPKVLSAIQTLINGENAKDWLPIEAAIKEDVANRKYATLVGKGLYLTNKEAERVFNEKNTEMAFSYVLKEFLSIPDDKYEITEADYQEYYNAHNQEASFQGEEESRDIKYVEFSLEPTSEDIAEITTELSDLVPAFVADSNDTAFILENGESPLESMVQYFTDRDIPAPVRDTVMNASIGTVFGPYRFGQNMLISKLSAVRLSPDSTKASHILIRVDDGDTTKLSAARVKLDSIRNVAIANKNFAELAIKYSDDLGSGEKGGELDWFTRGRMVPEFEKASFEGKVGDMVFAETQFGVHLIYITEQTEYKKSYLLSSVDLPIEPSKYTSDAVYKKASVFSVENNTQEKFEKIEELQILPADGLRMGEDMIAQIGPDSKEIIRWVYNDETEIGKVSTPIEIENKIVVCLLTNIREKGTISMEASKIFMKPEIVKAKKAAELTESYGTYSTLEEAASNVQMDIQRISSARFDDNNLPSGLGREITLLGALDAMESGSVSKPIVGNRGVFSIRLDGKNLPSDEMNLESIQTIEHNNFANRASRSAAEAVKNEAGIEDNRGRFY